MQEVMPFVVITEQRSYNNFATAKSIELLETVDTHRRCLSHQIQNTLLDQTSMQEFSRFDFEEKVCERYTRPYLDLELLQQKSKIRQPVKIMSVHKIKDRNSVSKSKQNICERGKKKGPGISISTPSKENNQEKLVKIQLGGCSTNNSKPKPKHKRIWLSKDFCQL